MASYDLIQYTTQNVIIVNNIQGVPPHALFNVFFKLDMKNLKQ